jgi:squalene-associated FAD-dependent desaturase
MVRSEQSACRRALIVGGGVAGLSCAVALAEHGTRVTVLEAGAEPGGRARSWRDDATGDVVDVGPHVVHSEYRNFSALLERCGTLGRIHWQPRKLITIASQPPLALCHRPLPPPFSLLPDFLQSPGMTARDFASNSRATWSAMKFGEEQVPELDRVNAEHFLRQRGVTDAMLDWFWRFACLAVMNTPLELCSAAALMRVHSQLIGRRGLHFGFPTVGLSELYVPQCVRRIQDAGGDVHVNAHVVKVENTTAIVAGGARFFADQCILAVPPRELEDICPGLAPTRAFAPSPYISCYLWFDRKITRERFWALPWSPQGLNTDFYDLSNIRAGLERSLVASNIIYSHRASALDDEEILRRTREEVARFVAPGKIVHARVHRIPMAIACPGPGTESRRPPARTAVANVYLAGDWTRTGQPSSMESAARSGFLAAGEILGREIALPSRPTEGLAGLVRRLS